MDSSDAGSVSSVEDMETDLKKSPVKNNKRKLDEKSDSEEEPEQQTDNKRATKKKELKGQKKSSADKALQVMNYTKATEQLYNNNLFRLQLDELLKEAEIKNKRKSALKLFLEEFNAIVEKLKPVTITNQDNLNLKSDQGVSLKFEKPVKVECFGLYENHCLPGPILETCLNLTMPRTCFHTKDFLNNRYFVKRLLYLTHIFKHLPYKKSFEFHNSNPLLSIINLQPGEDDKFIVKIFATPPEGYFKDERFLPTVNNMKQDLFQSGIKNPEVLKGSPTVLYNCTLAFDVTLHTNSRFISETLNDQEKIQKGIKLLCIWLKQRHLNVGFRTLSTDLLMYYVAFLLIKKKINNMMSPYQIVRNFWSFMASTGLDECNCLDNTEHADLFKSSFKVNLIDKSGCFNLAAFWDDDHVKKVREESRKALELLDSCNPQKDAFQCLFLTKVPICLQYDLVIDLTESLPLKDLFATTDEQKSKYIGYEQCHYVHEIKAFLKKGLSNRFNHIVAYTHFKYSEKAVLEKLQFGINLNAETAFNFIEKGPALSDFAEAEKFRQFWGHLSSDRRFRDGSTHVAVYFKTTTMRGKRHIIKRIIKYALYEKLNLKFQTHYDDFEAFLLAKRVVSPYPAGTNEEHALKCVTVADQLGQKLRNLKLPLSIFGIQGVSDAFSYCQVFPPVASKISPPSNPEEIKGHNMVFSTSGKKLGMVPRYIEPLEMVLKTEQSSKWPRDLEALKNVRTSYFLEIADLLAKENILCNVIQDYLQVYYEGLVFRYRIYLPHEPHLYDQSHQNEYIRNLKVLPQVNASLKGLQQQFPSYGPGTALIKRWLRSHMIDSHHLSDPIINLLNASLYLNQFSYSEPCSPQISFLRFLKFISDFDWETQPVLVNFNDQYSMDEIKEAETNLQQNRSALPPLVLLMPYDESGVLLTKNNPSRQVLGMVKALCQVTLNLVVDRIENCKLFDLNDLFKPSLDGFNLLIHIRALMNPRRHEQIDNGDSSSKIELQEYKHIKGEKVPIVGFNPVDLYLRSLRANYGNFATFFHDTYGGNIIGVLWNPQSNKGTLKQNNLYGMKVDGARLLFNEDALIEDFYLEGKGLVKWIEKNS